MCTPLLAIFGIGQTELIVVAIVVLILFGHRLPSVMGSLGRGIKDFKSGLNSPDEEPPAKSLDKPAE